jgi:hypothetical protein
MHLFVGCFIATFALLWHGTRGRNLSFLEHLELVVVILLDVLLPTLLTMGGLMTIAISPLAVMKLQPMTYSSLMSSISCSFCADDSRPLQSPQMVMHLLNLCGMLSLVLSKRVGYNRVKVNNALNNNRPELKAAAVFLGGCYALYRFNEGALLQRTQGPDALDTIPICGANFMIAFALLCFL